MKSQDRSFLERWEQVTNAGASGWKQIVVDAHSRQGFAIEESQGIEIRRVFQEESQGPNATLSVLEWKKNSEYGTTHLSKTVFQRSPSSVRCLEGRAKEIPQGSTYRYDLESQDNGYLNFNAGGRGSWESEVFNRFKNDFEKNWQSVTSRIS